MFVTVAVILCMKLAPGPLHLDRDCAPEVAPAGTML